MHLSSPLIVFVPAGIVALIGIILLGVGGNGFGALLFYRKDCASNGFDLDDSGCCMDYYYMKSGQGTYCPTTSLPAHVAELAIGVILIIGAGIGAFYFYRKRRQAATGNATGAVTPGYSFSMQGLTGVLKPKQQYEVPQYQEQHQPLQQYEPQPEAYQPTQPVYAAPAQPQQYAPPTQEYAPVGQEYSYQTAAYSSGNDDVSKHFSS